MLSKHLALHLRGRVSNFTPSADGQPSSRVAKKQFHQTVFGVTQAQGLQLGYRYIYMQRMIDARKHTQQDANLCKA